MTPENKPQEHPQTGPEVTITVDNQRITMHRGHQTVAAIKTSGGVPVGYSLLQVEAGKVVELPEDGSVTLKGGEVFQSHPKTGVSS